MGNRKKPTALAKLQGNPGKRPLNTNEPTPPKMCKFPPPPEVFKNDKVATDEWNGLGSVLFNMGLITPADLTAFMNYCKNRSRWLQAEENVSKLGIMIVYKDASGAPVMKKNPAVTASIQYQQAMHRMMTEFGLTPSSRSKIMVTEDDTDDMFTAQQQSLTQIDEYKPKKKRVKKPTK